MQPNKKPWPLITVFGIRERINTNPDFQRPAVWGTTQKQLLIDTILRNYDIPKLYWRKTGSKPDMYDVVDGQQRLRAIWEYFNNGFKLAKDSDSVDGEEIANKTYEELPDNLRMHFDTYPLDVVILEDTDEEEVREMFLRLQNGTTLKAQEKRNAYPGKMRDFVKELIRLPFFENVGFENKRFSHDLVAAQLVCLEIAGEPTNLKNNDLNKMYMDNVNFDTNSAIAKSVVKKLKLLAEIFSEKTPELERFNVIALYCVLSEIQKQFIVEEIKDKLFQWFIDFEKTRASFSQDENVSDDKVDSEWLIYKEKISHSTDSSDSIQFRMDFLMKDLMGKFPDLSRKDNQRSFTTAQRLAIFRRDKGICKISLVCDGVKVTWDDWHCDHVVPWSKGGKTTVANGQVACSSCNLKKNDRMM